ncbi:hypothetical protein D3C73_1668460 [compost metagenome]
MNHQFKPALQNAKLVLAGAGGGNIKNPELHIGNTPHKTLYRHDGGIGKNKG